MNESKNAFLEEEKLGALMRKYAIPCVISLLVAALYNIVDQIFIANADYLGSYGNAANGVVFPLTVVALAVAVMVGDGCCAFVSICLGSRNQENAHRSIGNSVVLCVVGSLILTVIYLIFQERRPGQCGDLCSGKVVFLLGYAGYSVLYVRTSHESHHPL